VSVADLESWILTVLVLAMLALELWALVDSAIRPAAAYTATDKLTKPGWLLILALALVVTLLFQSPMRILPLMGVVAAGVYLVDVRPALSAVTRR
jgi:hypothetical protein